MRRSSGLMAGVLAGMLVLNGCYGPFYLVRKVHKFNDEISDNKWLVEVTYLLMTWLPVYGLAGAADAIIFNSIEFWTGNNPLSPTAAQNPTKRIVRGDDEILLSKRSTPSGDVFLIQQLTQGQPGESLRMQRIGEETVAYNQAGDVVYRAQTFADGRVVVSDARGEQVAQYSSDQADQFLTSAAQ